MKDFNASRILSRKYFAPVFDKKIKCEDNYFWEDFSRQLDELNTSDLSSIFIFQKKISIVATALDSFQRDLLKHAGKIEKILNRTAKQLIDNQGDAEELKKLYDRAKDLNQKYLAISDFVGDLQKAAYQLKEELDETLEKVFRMQFAEQLKKARRNKNWTQQQLSEKADVPKTDISQFENGRKLPSLLTLAKLTEALEVPFIGLF